MQKFLGINNKSRCYRVRMIRLSQNKPCLLRLGVENNKNQSFLATIANVYNEIKKHKEVKFRNIEKNREWVNRKFKKSDTKKFDIR